MVGPIGAGAPLLLIGHHQWHGGEDSGDGLQLGPWLLSFAHDHLGLDPRSRVQVRGHLR